ncbi:hypothetical protein AWB67_02911 [Caballeronia terrestris]|jgi:hypothetical protein|uniref:Uncharacterized protein n=1 Tax=Caballeronia terrestris TaxID=1226301 RepID=A0A158IV45_9BURK|nr:hypothetical protein AWB67_02911 [Caballeronia terrestris]
MKAMLATMPRARNLAIPMLDFGQTETTDTLCVSISPTCGFS